MHVFERRRAVRQSIHNLIKRFITRNDIYYFSTSALTPLVVYHLPLDKPMMMFSLRYLVNKPAGTFLIFMAAEHFDQDNSGAAAGSGAGGGGAGGGASGGGVDDNVGLGDSHFCIAFVDYTQGYVFPRQMS